MNNNTIAHTQSFKHYTHGKMGFLLLFWMFVKESS